MEPKSFKEERIRRIIQLYYSRKDVQKALFDFSKNREVIPRYFEGFGKRPDTFQYPSDVFGLVKKGATSFHCSEELWEDPLKIITGMSEDETNKLRIGWDLLIDIDSKYIDYSKISAKIIIDLLKFHRIKNIGIKFSVSGDTPILIKNGNEISLIPILKAIDLIKKGKKLKVLSLDKNRKLRLSKIYDFLEHRDTLYEIKHSQSTIPLKSTCHHSVFIWDKGNIIQKKVTELKKKDFLISYNTSQNPLESKNIEVTNKFEFNKNQYSKKIINRKIKVNKDLMRLIGYFLAEGHVTNVINQVGFTFNKNEKEYTSDVKGILSSITGRKISIRHPNTSSTQILIHSKEWATFFDNFCGKKKDKHIPPFAFNASRELFLELLRGYIRGDGYKIGKYGIVVKSVSKRLISEMIWLCKLNNISCNLSFEKNKPHQLPQGTMFKGSLAYMLRIPKSELEIIEFNRKRDKFSPYPGDKVFPVDGLKEVYKQIKPKMFNHHRLEQVTLRKKKANLIRVRKVLDWFNKFKSIEPDENSSKILENYKKLFDSDISIVEIKEIIQKNNKLVCDISVEETESFFGNYYPILLHNSGSKGFHILIPWKAFPKEINNVQTKDMFPEYARIITQYIMHSTKDKLIEKITDLSRPSKYVRDFQAPKEVMPDIQLVSPRHLFRMPYSLHEKTALASVVINTDEIDNFQLKDADPMKVKIRNFSPDSEKGEASELLREALDWNKQHTPEKEKKTYPDYKPVHITDFSEKNFPPCVKNILKGITDGKKRALFVLINLFRSVGMDKGELEKMIYDWNKKNNPKLTEGYIKSQLSWSFRRKPVLPPNCKEFYQGIAVCTPDDFCKIVKNPVNYVIRKNLHISKENKSKRKT